MSGAHHPITCDNARRIKVTPLDFENASRNKKYRLMTLDHNDLSNGDPVVLIEWSQLQNRATGRELKRYVAYVEPIMAMIDDDDAVALHLIPVREVVDLLEK